MRDITTDSSSCITLTPTLSLRGRGRNRAAGVAYVAILAVAAIVITIGVAGIAASRAQSRAADLSSDIAEARLYAQSAIDTARTIIAADPLWRSNRSNGNWITNQAIGNGSFTLNVTNPTGSLNASPPAAVTVTGTGTKGSAVQKIQVTLSPVVTPVGALGFALFSGGAGTYTSCNMTPAGVAVGSNAAITMSGCDVYPDVAAALTAAGVLTTFHGTTTSLAPVRSLPASTAFTDYNNKGNDISVGSLPSSSGGNPNISNFLLSPSSNPFGGGSSSNGIYIIDCQGKTITISNCRIVGTLILKNPGTGSSIQGSVNWSPSTSNLPCLMVQGNITISLSSAALSEATINTNLNPSGTPYPYSSGTTNNTTTDSYPSTIAGLIYVTGNLSISNSPTLGPTIAGGTVTAAGNVTFAYNPIYYNNPPSGFYTATMPVLSGSLKQVVGP